MTIALGADCAKARQLPELIKEPMVVYDEKSRQIVEIIKAVDVTNECQPRCEGGRAVVCYGICPEGVVVQIEIWPAGYEPISCIHYFFESPVFLPDDPVFEFHARELGIAPQRLYDLVRAYAPTP